MTFQNKSKSLIPIHGNTLKDLCEKHKVKPETLPKLGKVDESNFSKYVEQITGHPSCPICNGEQGRTLIGQPRRQKKIRMLWNWSIFETKERWSGVHCLRFPVHTSVKHEHFGGICEHGYYVIECETCLSELKQKNFEKEGENK